MTRDVNVQRLPFPAPEESVEGTAVHIEKGFFLMREKDLSVVTYCGLALYHFRTDDGPARYLAMVDLIRHHDVSAISIARSFVVHRVTVQKMLARFEKKGIAGLFPGKGGNRPTKIRELVERKLLELKARGVTNSEAARRLGVTPNGVRAALHRLGYKVPEPVQPSLPMPGEATEAAGVAADDALPTSAPESPEVVAAVPDLPGAAFSAPSEEPALNETSSQSETVAGPAPFGVDSNPLDRSGDRMMARLGLLDDAKPLFASGILIPHAGVLLAVPALVESQVFDITAELYKSLGPAFYGLRTTVLAFLLMALLRIRRIENLKETVPQDLGHILGLDRAPEMKTLREKLQKLAARDVGLALLRRLAKARAKRFQEAMGYLYIDGHVRVYSGQAKLPKAHVTQRNLCMPGTTDYWVNDRDGQPLLVITAEANDALTTMLQPVLAEVKPLLGGRRATVAFDRGGWSPKLFATLILDGFDVMTYRKGKATLVALKDFKEFSATIEGHEVTYKLAEQSVPLLRGKLTMRQVTRLRDNGKQTQILTNRLDLPIVEIPYRMFARWRQENFFKYMEDEYALDALVDYGQESTNPNRSVPNPELKALQRELKEARAEQASLEREYGTAAIENSERKRPTMRGFKNAIGRVLSKPLLAIRTKIQELLERREALPKRVPLQEATGNSVPVKLRVETKRITDTFKLVAYQAESALFALLRPHYRRSDDEGRTLVSTALQSSAYLDVRDGELVVTLSPLSSAHRTAAIRALCDELNKSSTCFPGTSLRLRFGIDDKKL